MRNADACWDEFDPSTYLAANYLTVLDLDRAVLSRLARFYAAADPAGRAVDIGTGPNLYPLMAAVGAGAREVGCIEFGAENLGYLRSELQDPSPHWAQFWEVLVDANPSWGSIDWRARLADVDVRYGSVFDLERDAVDVATMFFVAESCTSDEREFHAAVASFLGHVTPGGRWFIALMEGSNGYETPGRAFPAVPVTSASARSSIISAGGEIEAIEHLPGSVRPGHDGCIVAWGTR